MHDFTTEDRQVLHDVADWTAGRRISHVAGGHEAEPSLLDPAAPATRSLPPLTDAGMGTAAVWSALRDQVLPTAFATDHPRYLAFVGGAPSVGATIADAALSAAAVYGGSQMEAGDVVLAERSAARWLCDLVGFPAAAHGVFVSGGSLANLSALVAARHGRRGTDGRAPHVIVVGASAHSSIRSAAAIMGCEVLVAGSTTRPLAAADLHAVSDQVDPRDVVAVVATAGATNTGFVDHLDQVADWCAANGAWLHVDAAYGGPAMLAVPYRASFTGVERADSVTIDPHKWLFTPYDCAAVLYRDPGHARAAHTQQASYLDVVNDDGCDNPSDYSVQLSRRARGLPLWASLVAHGTAAHTDAVERCLETSRYAAKAIEASARLELVTAPSLSVLLFRRLGWTPADLQAWSARARAQGLALLTPTTHDGEQVLRICVVNPLTTCDDIDAVLTDLERDESAG